MKCSSRFSHIGSLSSPNFLECLFKSLDAIVLRLELSHDLRLDIARLRLELLDGFSGFSVECCNFSKRLRVSSIGSLGGQETNAYASMGILILKGVESFHVVVFSVSGAVTTAALSGTWCTAFPATRG